MFEGFLTQMSGWVETFGYLGLFAASIIGAATVIFPLPTDGLIIAAGSFLVPFWVGVVGGVGTALGELSTYYIGKGGRFVVSHGEHNSDGDVQEDDEKMKKEQKWYKHAESMFEKYGFWTIPVFSFTPLPMDAIGIFCGAIEYDVKKFFVGALIGKLARSFLLAYAASYAAPWFNNLLNFIGVGF